MYLAVYSLSFLAISQLLLMGLINVVYFRNERAGRMTALLSICLISVVIVLLPTITDEIIGLNLLLWLAYGAPAVLWIIAYNWFEDDREISLRAWSILVGYQIMIAISRSSYAEGNQAFFYISLIAFAFMMGIILHIILLSIKGRNADLVEHRRRMRAPFAIGQSILLGVVIFIAFINLWSEVDRLQDPFYSLILATYAAIFVFILFINIASFEVYGRTSSTPVSVSFSTTPSTEQQEIYANLNPKILLRLTELMESKELYRDPKLTIKALAENIFVSEHKLRRIINQRMGFRNFNQYLNQYRITKAKALLNDAYQMPINSIALEVGFASLSSFNKAFKQITGVTPTEFRRNDPERNRQSTTTIAQQGQ